MTCECVSLEAMQFATGLKHVGPCAMHELFNLRLMAAMQQDMKPNRIKFR
jgi:hypothetical protein